MGISCGSRRSPGQGFLLHGKTRRGSARVFLSYEQSSRRLPLLSFPTPPRSEMGFWDEKRAVEPSREVDQDPGPDRQQLTSQKPILELNDPMHFHRVGLLPTQTEMSECFFFYYMLTSKQRPLNHKTNSNTADPAGTKFSTSPSTETLPDTTLSQ